MKRCAVLLGLLWVLLLAVPLELSAQQESPFDKLWADFDRGSSYWYKNKSQKLDTIEQLAMSERNAYHLFRANWERTYLDEINDRATPKTALLRIDSLIRMNVAAQWGDPDAALYTSLYHYLMGMVMVNVHTGATTMANTRNTDLRRLEEWTDENFRTSAKEHFRTCFDQMPTDSSFDIDKWDFMMLNTSGSVFTPSFFEILAGNCLNYFFQDEEMVDYLVTKAINNPHAQNHPFIQIEFELQRLSHIYELPSYPVELSDYWQGVELLEEKYGPNEAFDYIRGGLLYFANQQTEYTTDYAARALDFFKKVSDNGEVEYYRQNASYYVQLLTLPRMSLGQMNAYFPLDKKLRIPINYSNIDTLYVSVYKCPRRNFDYPQDEPIEYENEYSTQFEGKELEPVCTQRFVLNNHGKNWAYTTELWLDSLPIGHYDLFFHLNPEPDSSGALIKTEISVSRMWISKWNAGSYDNFAINDYQTGEPISLRSVKTPLKFPSLTNRFGEVHSQRLFTSYRDFMWVKDKNTKYKFLHSFYGVRYGQHMHYGRSNSKYYASAQLITDRNLYRPGQNTYFKVVLYKNGKVLPNKPVMAELRDSKDVVLDTINLITNEFGSTTGEFKLPQKIGKYILRVIYPASIKQKHYEFAKLEVAEYKLPSFKVKLMKDTTQVAVGDTLTIRGCVTALSGYPLRDASVALTVKCMGTERFDLLTDEDGCFTYRYAIPISPVPLILSTEAIVTDLNGETHQDQMAMEIPCDFLRLELCVKEDVDLSENDTLRMVIQPVNFEWIPQPVPLRVTVMRLQSPDAYKIPVLDKEPKHWNPLYSEEEYARQFPYLTWNFKANQRECWPVVDTVFVTERLFAPDSLLLIDARQWKTGDYRIHVEGVDKRGDTVAATRFFTVNRSLSTEMNAFMPIRAAFVDTPTKKGEKVSFSVGSFLMDAVMICDVYQGVKRLKTLRVPLNHEQKVVSVKTRKGGDRSITVLARIVQHGELHQTTINRDVADPKTMQALIRYAQDHILNAELTHYHNVAEPGESEEWEITVTDGHEKGAKEVEMLAWMMDCSLYELGMKEPGYKLKSKRIPRSLSRKVYSVNPYMQCNNLTKRYCEFVLFRKAPKRNFQSKPYISIRPFSSTIWSKKYFGKYQSGQLEAVAVKYEPPLFDADNTASRGRSIEDALSNLNGVSSEDGSITSVRGNRSDGQQVIVDGVRMRDERNTFSIREEPTKIEKPVLPPDIRVRKNFTETAFFYPQLCTDEQGRVKLRFTLPDQYTSWQLFATAHNKQMATCSLTAYLQSRRTMMLQSNAPRFLREGDTLHLQAKITNRSDTALSGIAVARFFNPETEAPVALLMHPADSVQTFRCEPNSAVMVSWQLLIPEDVSAVGYRLLAKSGYFGDGEENILPVLPNRVLVTEAQHFVVQAHTDKEFTFHRYREAQTATMRPLSYTVELTANPVWIAIQSLPSLMRYPYECNEQLFGKLFAAAVVRHALKQNPELKDVVELWRNDTVNGSVESPLLKNEALHNILLEETPWLSTAQNESQQRRENAELFSADNIDRQLTHNLNKLMRNQLPGGGWSWYGRYYYSRYITDYLIAGFYKLQRLGMELPADAERMLAKAIRQSDKAQEERYQKYLEERKEHPETEFYFSEEDVHYLYARSFAPMDTAWVKKPYVRNLLNLSINQIYAAPYMHQAEVALVMYRFGMPEAAKDIVAFLRNNAFADEELGMYWGEKPGSRQKDWRIRAYYPWYEAPVERQAMLIEAFAEISPQEDELSAMKQWILLQKESHSWKSTKASSAAVYALLLDAPKDLLVPARTWVEVGDESFMTAQENNAEACSGYLKHVWTAEEMTPQLASVYVHADRVHPVFGACYWQYLEIPDKVTASGDGLTIRRTLLHRPGEGDGAHAEPVTAENPMRLGERVTVRLVISSDRELEYVHVKDPRAAAFEPVNIHERRGGNQGVWWVESPRDAAEHFFLNRLPQGTVIIEYDFYVTQTGTFSHGPASIECMYAPDHRAQSNGERVTIKHPLDH